jgi:glycosyltransferase involved in cell wall biosynthesis
MAKSAGVITSDRRTDAGEIMKAGPLVSVIIPTYNRADIVCRAIDSVLAQTYRNLEVIVVDDGSKDDTPARLAAYGDRIIVLRQENAGPSIARNRGIARAQGSIIAFLDSDDYWLPEKLARQVEVLEKAGPSAVCCLCNCTIVYNDGSRGSTFQIADTMPGYPAALWLNPAEVLTTRFVIFSQAIAIRRECLERVGYFDEELPFFCEDYELALRLSLEGPWTIIADELVVCQDASPGSLGQQALQNELRLREDQLQMRKRIAALVNGRPSETRLRKLAKRELQLAKRRVMAVKISRLQIFGAATLAWLLRKVERVRKAFWQRTPLYPRMAVKELS